MEEMGNVGKGLIDMCRKEGEIKGIVKMAALYKENKDVTIKRLMQEFNLSEEEVTKKYEEYSELKKV